MIVRFGWGVRQVAAVVLAMLLQTVAAHADTVFPGAQWEHIDPVRAGWSASKLDEVRAIAAESGSSALLVVQDGRVVLDWGQTKDKIFLHSVRKSLMSGLYGPAVASGQISLSATMAGLGIDDAPKALTAEEKQATVRDLLMARSGVYIEAAGETRSMKERRPERGSHAPGTFFYYNNWDFNVLGAILEQRTGGSMFRSFSEWIAEPIGMQDFIEADGHYKFADTSRYAYYHFTMTARDLARYGWLYLNHGRWRNKAVLPEVWVRESTRPLSKAWSGIAYGYMWWATTGEMQFGVVVGPNSYSARGAGGQFLVILPAHRMVIAHLVDTEDEGDHRQVSNQDFGRMLKALMEASPGARGPNG